MGDQQMKLILALAMAVTAAVGLGGCFGHHQQATVVEPVYEPIK